MHKILSFIVICSCSFFNCLEANELVTAIEALLEQPDSRFNGAILIAQDDNILYQRIRGYSNIANQIPIGEKTQFLIGSISKQITSVLVLRAVDAKLLNLDTPIKNYLPELQENWAEVVHLHHLLNHTSGIQSLDSPLAFQPGEKFAYSNVGYDLMGQILEHVTGKNYSILVEELCQKKCGMLSTAAPPSGLFDDLNRIFLNIATGRSEKENAGTILLNENRDVKHNPSSGIISTIKDLWKWNSYIHSGRLLSAETYALLINPSIERNHRWGKIEYGYGIQISNAAGVSELSHNGIIPGYMSSLFYYPKERISVIILENRVLWTNDWTIAEQKHVFQVHDGIRDIVRRYMLISENKH